MEGHSLSALTVSDLDYTLSRYVSALYQDIRRRGQLQQFQNTIYSLEFFVSSLSSKMAMARQTASRWDINVISKSPLPLSQQIADALATWFIG